jgi:hypothetical protein
MSWTAKPGVPVSFDLASAFTSLVTGDTAWDWLLAWAPSFGLQDTYTADFCAAGPPVWEYSPLVWLPVAGRTPIQTALNIMARIQTARHLAEERVFGAYCEQSVPAGTYSIDLYQRACVDYPGNWNSGVRPIPAGSAHMRVSFDNAVAADPTHGWAVRIRYDPGADRTGEIDLVEGHVGGAGTLSYHPAPFTVTTGYTHYEIFVICEDGGSVCVDVKVEFDGGGSTNFPLPDVTQPANYVAPATRTYDTIAQLGAELDAQELKLDLITQLVTFLASQTPIAPAGPVDEPVPVEPDAPVDVTDAAGVIVTLASIPSWADENFGTPVQLHRIGRIDFGSADGWHTSVEITHTPMLVMPLPLGTTRMQVNTHPVVGATLQVLKKPK